MLILAGVTIAMLTGDNGVLTKSQTAKTKSAQKTGEEEIAVAVMNSRVANEDGKIDNFALYDELTQTLKVTSIQAGEPLADVTSGATVLPWTVTYKGYTYEISEIGKVTHQGGDGETAGGGSGPVVPTVALTTLTVTPATASLAVGSTQDLTVTKTPENTTDTLKFLSSNRSVATVDNTGKITAVSAGTATITVSGTTATSVTATCDVTVADNITVSATATRSKGTIPSEYTANNWQKLEELAKIISDNSSTINYNTEKVTITKNGTTYGELVVGDTTTVTFNGSSKEVRILGFNHDELTDKTAATSPYNDGKAHTYAGISFQFTNSLGTSKGKGNSSGACIWPNSVLKVSENGLDSYYLPKININSSIKYVKKVYINNLSSTSTPSTTTDDKLWLLSASEIYEISNGKYGSGQTYTKAKEGERYKYFALGYSPALDDGNHWLRSPDCYLCNDLCMMGEGVLWCGQGNSCFVIPCFSI